MLKEAKRKARLAQKRAKRKNLNEEEGIGDMHDISKPITLEDLTNPDKK